MSAPKDDQSVREDLPLLEGFAGGVVAFLVGYVVTFVVKASDAANAFGGLDRIPVSEIPTPADWQIVAWFFYQMHNVGVDVSLSIAGESGSRTISGQVESWLLVVPVVLLIVGGFVVARTADAESIPDGVVAGATVTPGYLVLAVVLALLAGWSVSRAGGSLSVGPNIVAAAILAGIVYPVVFGGIGGAVSGAIEQ